MAEQKPIWYIAGQDKQPKGPFTAVDLFNQIRKGRMPETTPCWRKGLEKWQPLAETEPFHSALNELKKKLDLVHFHCPCGNKIAVARKYAGRQAKCTQCGQKVTIPDKNAPDPQVPVLVPAETSPSEPDQSQPILIPVSNAGDEPAQSEVLSDISADGHESGSAVTDVKPARSATKVLVKVFLILIVVLGAAGGAAGVYFFVLDPPEIRKAKKLIDTGFYAEAERILSTFYREHSTDTKAIYLLAIAKTNLYVAPDASRYTFYAYGDLREVRSLLTKVFRAKPKRIEQAKADFAALCASPKNLNELQRILPVYELRVEFKLAEEDAMAAELISHARAQCRSLNDWQACQKVLMRALEWDASLASQLSTRILATCKIDDLKWMRSAPLQSLVRSCPAFSKAFSQELLRQAEDAASKKEYDRAEAFLACLGRCDRQMLPVIAQRRRDYLAGLLAAGKVSEAVVILDATCRESSDMRRVACEFYLQAAKLLADEDKAQAEKLLMKAVELDPAVLDSRENLLLYTKIGTPGRTKLRQLQNYLKSHTDHQDRLTSLKAIVEDCLAVLEGGRIPFTNREYLPASYEAGKELLAEHAEESGLDRTLADLAKCLKNDGRYERQAVDLMQKLIAAFPNSGLRQDMATLLHQWQNEGRRNPFYNGPNKPTPRTEQIPERIVSVSRLREVLSGNDPNIKVMWVAVSKRDVDDRMLESLRDWIEKGRVLWLETDLARDLGFGLPTFKTQELEGLASRYVGPHPLQFERAQRNLERFFLAKNGLVLRMSPDVIKKMEEIEIWPILVFGDRRPGICIVCAVHRWKNGHVIFRPKELPQAIEQKLLTYSLAPFPFVHTPPSGSGLRPGRR